MNPEVHEHLNALTAARYARLRATGTEYDARTYRIRDHRRDDFTAHGHGLTFNKRLIYADPDVEVYAVGEAYALDYLSRRRPKLPTNIEEFIVSMLFTVEPRGSGYSFTRVEQIFDLIGEAFSESVNGSDLLGQLSEITEVETGEDEIRDECFFEILVQAVLSVEGPTKVYSDLELEYEHRYRHSMENDDNGIVYEVIDVRSDRRPQENHPSSSGLSPEVTEFLQQLLSRCTDEEVDAMVSALRLLSQIRSAFSRDGTGYF